MTDLTAGFPAFARYAMARRGFGLAAHQELLADRLEAVAAGECDRLMVQMPPGSAKSTYGSVLFPAYFLARQPGAQVIAAAHTASLAHYFGRHVRGAIEEHADRLGVGVAKASKGATSFALESGAEYFAAGVRGPITGRRADLVVIDDPVKSWAEAESRVARDALYDWYRAELSARLKPGGRVVLIMTRWHEDDLAGRLLARDGRWACLRLPAIAGADDALGRAPGEVLWPEWQSREAVLRRRVEVGERAFAAMYQQAPQPPSARMFAVEKLSVVAQAPVVTKSVRAWDLAASWAGAGHDPDYTVGLKLGVTGEGLMVVLDVVRFRAGPAEVEARIREVARLDGKATVVGLPRDPGQAGAAQVMTLTSLLAGYTVVASAERDAKAVRAMPAATQVDAGNLVMVAAPWNDALVAELRAFPDADKDDQVDALSRAVNTLRTMTAQPSRRLDVPFLSR